MTSNTATATLYPLHLTGRQVVYNPKAEQAAQRAKLKQIRLENQLMAAEYAQIMLQRHINEALDPATDPRLRRDLRNDVLAHGVGKPREIESEASESKRQGTDANDMVRALAAFSVQALASQQRERLERDVTSQTISTEDEAIKFLDELQSGVLIDHEGEDEND
ncbi:hypothetical protein RBI94_08575 [Pseudomonas putida]|uniref:hypothetical protein n=1 Tax=Pseudomonas putida TaxID=303 RepID=UPI00077172B3|nr:hypothetical protein [Pseudomonas putida]KWW13230.1 hypothetical protein AS889_16280 [Pseudomonas putida]MDQ2484065.1 hypothetical protein [Pseudomonas putida]